MSHSWFSRVAAPAVCILALSLVSAAAADEVASVKKYLVNTVTKMQEASQDFVKNADAYAAIIAANKENYSVAYQSQPKQIDDLISKMQDNYKAMDSYGYETVEGIVAGVDSLALYDIYLDAGVPKSEGLEDVAPVVLDLGNGKKIDREGSLFTHIIEPALWNGNPKWGVEISKTKTLPRAEVLVASAKDVNAKIGTLLADSKAWNASVSDCFGAMIVMTPTLSDYFEDWKESRFSADKSGKFQAVSRISDMTGIMSSCDVMYKAVKDDLATKDKALAKSINLGFNDILNFLDQLDKREKAGKITASEIDELAEQAKEKTDKLVPQIEQGSALLGFNKAG